MPNEHFGSSEQQRLWQAVTDGNNEVHQVRVEVGQMDERLDNLRKEVEKLVTRHEFAPVKLLAYGLAGSILAGVVAALLALVIARH